MGKFETGKALLSNVKRYVGQQYLKSWLITASATMLIKAGSYKCFNKIQTEVILSLAE